MYMSENYTWFFQITHILFKLHGQYQQRRSSISPEGKAKQYFDSS